MYRYQLVDRGSGGKLGIIREKGTGVGVFGEVTIAIRIIRKTEFWK